MDSGQRESLHTPRRAQKCLFAPSNNTTNNKNITYDANCNNNKVTEISSGEESDLGPMSPLALTDQSPSHDSSSGREYISPFTTPEKSPNLHISHLSWDRLKSRYNRENHISPFSSLKKVTRAARYSPRCKLFNISPRSLQFSPSKQVALLTPERFKITEEMANEIVPETPQTTRSFATEIQNQDITETPRKSRSLLHKQMTPFWFINKTTSLPKLHRRKSLSSLETSELRDFSPRQKENILKRHAQDQLMTTSAKLFKTDDASCAPRARAALFQDRRTECDSLKNFSLSTGKFYSSNARTERPFAINIKNNDSKRRRSLSVQSNKRLLKKQKFGRINAGVFHGIKRPKPKVHSEVSKNIKQYSTQNSLLQNISKDTSPAERAQPVNISVEKVSSTEINENKRFFKTNKTIRHNAATVTVNNKIKLKVTDGKIVLNTNRASANASKLQQIQTNIDVLLDATDLTVDEPEVETTLEQNKMADLLKILEDDWQDDYDKMVALPCSSNNSSSVMTSTISPLKPVMVVPTDSIMSPASELINLTSTMNIKDVDSQTYVRNLSPNNTNNNDTEGSKRMEKESGRNKYFPIFNQKYFASGNIFEETSNTKPNKATKRTQWQLSAKGGGADQYQLDVGQKRFGATQCPECNIVYQLGDPEDENAHLNYHNSIHVLKFHGWKNERVIMEDSFTSSRIILVEPHDSKQYWKKISDILTVVDRDLGLSNTDISEYQNKKIYLYIREKTILGVLVAESITKAHRMIPDLVELDCCTAESTPTKCGINVVWTAMSHRKQGIATKLVDILRATFFYGYMMTLDDIAFSIPTPSGKIFAEKYSKTRNFKVYN
ncbi:N-acetyltransferase ESCO1 [Pseudomyrmex gracilis]|uniref:N-acetyltransferase ESCO1 n=1 Tax=Pseudomyrmex gracilis TaxID=219809 RepID=UPI000994BA20|nr:N-acetyltransferase ESCO1 [Pseudomyrmex gracilis]